MLHSNSITYAFFFFFFLLHKLKLPPMVRRTEILLSLSLCLAFFLDFLKMWKCMKGWKRSQSCRYKRGSSEVSSVDSIGLIKVT